jgi:membrane associated rhomboid family serine protease
MFKSIIDDLKYALRTGNMITKIIIINVIVYVIAALLYAFSHTIPFNTYIDRNFALSNQLQTILFHPWTLLTHMFLHVGFFHILWNMVGLNLFGGIVGDLLGDKRILPLYLFSGLVGGCIYILSTLLMGQMGSAMGASAAVMGLAITAGLVAPDYVIRLLLIGDVKLKYIVFAFIFFDIIGTQASVNAGGSYGHLGGALGGFLFIYFYKKGIDILLPISSLLDYLSKLFSKVKQKEKYNPKMKVEYRAESLSNKMKQVTTANNISKQERIDRILDKINDKGYTSLTVEEKDFLTKASKE